MRPRYEHDTGPSLISDNPFTRTREDHPAWLAYEAARLLAGAGPFVAVVEDELLRALLDELRQRPGLSHYVWSVDDGATRRMRDHAEDRPDKNPGALTLLVRARRHLCLRCGGPVAGHYGTRRAGGWNSGGVLCAACKELEPTDRLRRKLVAFVRQLAEGWTPPDYRLRVPRQPDPKLLARARETAERDRQARYERLMARGIPPALHADYLAFVAAELDAIRAQTNDPDERSALVQQLIPDAERWVEQHAAASG